MDVSSDPMVTLQQWFEAAHDDAMTLATATPDGHPSARTVLCKHIDSDGLLFFTSYRSRKAQEIESNPQVACLFYFPAQERQVILEGTAERTSRKESEAYFGSRPRGSQLGAWASESQSSPIESRALLEELQQKRDAEFETVPCPPYWGGYRVTPQRVELWQGRSDRLHDRFEYTRTKDGWQAQRLSP